MSIVAVSSSFQVDIRAFQGLGNINKQKHHASVPMAWDTASEYSKIIKYKDNTVIDSDKHREHLTLT